MKNIAEITFSKISKVSYQDYIDFFVGFWYVKTNSGFEYVLDSINQCIRELNIVDKKYKFIYVHSDIRNMFIKGNGSYDLISGETMKYDGPLIAFGCNVISNESLINYGELKYRIIVSENELENFNGCSHYEDIVRSFEIGV